MIDQSLLSIKQGLEALGYTVETQKDTSQIYVLLKVEEKECPMFIKEVEPSSLEFLLFFPFKVSKSAVSEIARLLHLLNKELETAAFGLDEESEIAFHRNRIYLPSKGLNQEILEEIMKSNQFLFEKFAPLIEAVLVGALSVDSLLEEKSETP